jgi:nucleotide-binding universal stress UspA family protein
MAEHGEPTEEGVHGFRRLLIPLDGSPMAEAVAPSAARLAEKAGASVMLLHLIEQHAPAAVHGSHHITSHQEAESYLRQVAEKHFAGHKVSWHVHTDGIRDVAHSVSSHAEEFDPDLIIMCSHDHVGWWRWFWGSLGQQVVREAMPPVLLFRYEDALSPEFPFRRVLIPLDGDTRHETGVEAGGELASLSNAPVDLVQVVPTRSTLAGPGGITRSYLPATTEAILDLAENQARAYLAGQLERVTDRGLRGTAAIARGDPFEEILAYTGRVRPDLLVLGTHGKIGTQAFWAGSIAQRFLDSCNTTFLLAPAKE